MDTLAIDPNTPATVYAGTFGDGVFKSTNGGEDWTAMNTGLIDTHVFALAVDPSTPTTIYAGTWKGGVFKSTNGGENWTAMNTGLTNAYVRALAVDPINPSALYAGTENGVFKIEQKTCPTPGVVSNPSPSNQAANVSTNPTLSWSGSSNADSYDVYFGTTSDPTTLVGSTTSTSFPLPGLNLNTTYYWKIVARNNCGQSTSGPVWSFSTVQPSTYTLTVTKSGTGGGPVTSSPAGINCGDDCSEAYNQGTVVSLTATPSSGSTFEGWSGACSGTGQCSVTMDADKTVTATFTQQQQQQYSLMIIKSGTGNGTVTSSPAGINCGDDCSETYTKVQKVKLTAKAETNSTFTGWSGGGCSGTKTCTVTVNAQITVTASFAAKLPDIAVSLESLDFGGVKVGKKLTKTLKITNNGTGELRITIDGIGGTEFSISGSSNITIKSKKSYNVKVTFKPTSTGSKTATLEIHSNDPDTPVVEVALTGTGQ